jgi:hypothetical protein
MVAVCALFLHEDNAKLADLISFKKNKEASLDLTPA